MLVLFSSFCDFLIAVGLLKVANYICYEGRNYTLEVKQRQKTPIELSLFMTRGFIAELPRAEGARTEPHTLEILVNPSSRENLVMTSPYERASERRPYRLWGGGEEPRGSANGETEECHLFLAGFLKKRKLISIYHINK